MGRNLSQPITTVCKISSDLDDGEVELSKLSSLFMVNT